MLMPSIFGEHLLDDFFREPFRKFPSFHETNGVMRTDVKELENSYEISIALPGVKKENISAELKDGYLTVSANNSKSKDETDGKEHYIRRERYYGSASRSFYIGDNITENEIRAKYNNGILELTVPKKEAKLPEPEQKKYISIEG